jgi:hypothetical protein
MSKALFVAELDLNPGKSGADAEAFCVEEFVPNAAELSGKKAKGNERRSIPIYPWRF